MNQCESLSMRFPPSPRQPTIALARFQPAALPRSSVFQLINSASTRQKFPFQGSLGISLQSFPSGSHVPPLDTRPICSPHRRSHRPQPRRVRASITQSISPQTATLQPTTCDSDCGELWLQRGCVGGEQPKPGAGQPTID